MEYTFAVDGVFKSIPNQQYTVTGDTTDEAARNAAKTFFTWDQIQYFRRSKNLPSVWIIRFFDDRFGDRVVIMKLVGGQS